MAGSPWQVAHWCTGKKPAINDKQYTKNDKCISYCFFHFPDFNPIKLIIKIARYIMKPYMQTGNPSKEEQPPNKQTCLASSLYDK